MTDRRFVNLQNLNEQGTLLEIDCRFCHIQQKYDKYEHVAPCGCVGATRYVHRQCIIRWATVKFQHVYNHAHSGDPESFNVFCQVCQQRMEIEYEVTRKISKYEDVVEKIIGNKLLFSVLLLLSTGLIIAIIILALFSGGNIHPNFIYGIAACCLGLLIVVFIFIWNFMVIKTIKVKHVANNKTPQILGLQRNMDDVEEEEEEEERNPHFGVQQAKRETQIDKSLMIQSKRDSGEGASSVVSKTLTDYVMKRMYKHDERGKSQKQLNSSKYIDRSSHTKRQPFKQKKDQGVQISNLQYKNVQVQYTDVQKQDRSIQKTVNNLGQQQVQKPVNIKNQSIQQSSSKKNISVQPSFLPKMNKTFKQDNIIPPSFNKEEDEIEKISNKPRQLQKSFATQNQQNKIVFTREYQKPKNKILISSGESKRSQEQMIEKEKGGVQSKLKLKSSSSPIKIKVMF